MRYRGGRTRECAVRYPDATNQTPSCQVGSTGVGTASKSAVKKMVNKLLRSDIRNGHEADAADAAIAGLLRH